MEEIRQTSLFVANLSIYIAWTHQQYMGEFFHNVCWLVQEK